MRALLILLLLLPLPLLADTRVLTLAEWSVPRNGGTVLAMPPLRETIAELTRRPETSLLLRYPGGEAGTLWAEELRAWLVALAVDPQRIELHRGSRTADTIELSLNEVEP